MRVSNRLVRFVALREGFRRRPYRDTVGVWTIGFGETLNVGPHTPPIGLRDAYRRLRRRLDRDYGAEVERLAKVPLTQRQHDALTSLAYNIGTGAFATSTVLRELNLRHYAKAANHILDWDKAGGRSLLGLARRRRAERRMFLRGSDKRTRRNARKAR